MSRCTTSVSSCSNKAVYSVSACLSLTIGRTEGNGHGRGRAVVSCLSRASLQRRYGTHGPPDRLRATFTEHLPSRSRDLAAPGPLSPRVRTGGGPGGLSVPALSSQANLERLTRTHVASSCIAHTDTQRATDRGVTRLVTHLLPINTSSADKYLRH